MKLQLELGIDLLIFKKRYHAQIWVYNFFFFSFSCDVTRGGKGWGDTCGNKISRLKRPTLSYRSSRRKIHYLSDGL